MPMMTSAAAAASTTTGTPFTRLAQLLVVFSFIDIESLAELVALSHVNSTFRNAIFHYVTPHELSRHARPVPCHRDDFSFFVFLASYHRVNFDFEGTGAYRLRRFFHHQLSRLLRPEFWLPDVPPSRTPLWVLFKVLIHGDAERVRAAYRREVALAPIHFGGGDEGECGDVRTLLEPSIESHVHLLLRASSSSYFLGETATRPVIDFLHGRLRGYRGDGGKAAVSVALYRFFCSEARSHLFLDTSFRMNELLLSFEPSFFNNRAIGLSVTTSASARVIIVFIANSLAPYKEREKGKGNVKLKRKGKKPKSLKA